MKRILLTATLTLMALLFRPAPARADLTAFWGFSPTPVNHQAHGFSIGVNKTLLGAEFEWRNMTEKAPAPRLKTYIFNGMLITPGHRVQSIWPPDGGATARTSASSRTAVLRRTWAAA